MHPSTDPKPPPAPRSPKNLPQRAAALQGAERRTLPPPPISPSSSPTPRETALRYARYFQQPRRIESFLIGGTFPRAIRTHNFSLRFGSLLSISPPLFPRIGRTNFEGILPSLVVIDVDSSTTDDGDNDAFGRTLGTALNGEKARDPRPTTYRSFSEPCFSFFFPFLSSVSFEESSNNDSFIIRNRNCESLVRIFRTIVTIKLLIKLLIENLSFPSLSLYLSFDP